MAGLRLNLTAREMREVVSSQAREEERGFRRSQSREERKMSFKEKGKWFHGLKPAKFAAAAQPVAFASVSRVVAVVESVEVLLEVEDILTKMNCC